MLNVLNELYEAKADSFLAKGDLLAYRICKMVRAWAAMWKIAAPRLQPIRPPARPASAPPAPDPWPDQA